MANADGNVFLTAADAAGVVETAAAQATEYAGSVNARERMCAILAFVPLEGGMNRCLVSAPRNDQGI